MCKPEKKKPISVQIWKLSLKIWDKRRLKSKAGHVHWWLMSVNQKLNPGKNSILALESCVKLNACWMWFNGFFEGLISLKIKPQYKIVCNCFCRTAYNCKWLFFMLVWFRCHKILVCCIISWFIVSRNEHVRFGLWFVIYIYFFLLLLFI